jgi:NADH dehydrogenase
MTFVVVGAGPTGVELAGQLAILSRRVLERDYRRIDPAAARILLVDGADAVLPPFAPRLREQARRDLQTLGVEVALDELAVAVDAEGIEIRGPGGEERRIQARTVLWAAGVQASPLARALGAATGAETDRAGRLSVGPDLSLPGHPEVFAVGDMVRLDGVPGVAPAAIQAGAYVAKVVRHRLQGRDTHPFHYLDKGSVATIGRARAVAQISFVKLWGLPAFLLWGVVHLAYLVGWGNRYEAVMRWLWTLAARNRRERLISVTSLVSDEQAQRELEALRGRGPPA